MRILHGKNVKDYVGRREIILMACLFIVSIAIYWIDEVSPAYIMPAMSLGIVMGLLYGPYACISINLTHLIFNVYYGAGPWACLVDFVAITMITYIPYRIWYSLWMNQDDRPPVLDSVKNIVKFAFVVVVSSLIYAILNDLTRTMIDGDHSLDMGDVAVFFNAMAFSFLLGMTGILLLRYFGIRFHTPRFGGTPESPRHDIPTWVYYMCLALGLLLPQLLLLAFPTDNWAYAANGISYAFLILFLLVPMEHARAEERTVLRRGVRINAFNGKLIERLIVIFLIYGLIVCVIVVMAGGYGLLAPAFGLHQNDAVAFYMSLTLMAFLLPSLAFLWYIERNVTQPIGIMSEASKNFINDDYGESGEEFQKNCKDLLEYDTEIGDLARSLVKMTGDIEDYIKDIKSLNSQQEMYRAELKVAQNIQESFVPMDFESVNGMGVTVAGYMDAARYVGGDFFDFYMIDNDHIGLSIGDVSGKGVPAALFMGVTKSLLESHSHPGMEPSEIMAKVNINLCRRNGENMFVSSWLGILELSTGKLRYANAGHNPPILVRDGEEATTLETKPGLVLGAREGVRYPALEADLSPGDRILLYTDGVTEANADYKGFYGIGRLMDVLNSTKGLEPCDQISAVIDDISGFTEGAEQFDDITMLLFRYDGIGKTS